MSLPVWAGVALALTTVFFVLGFWEVRQQHRRFIEAEVARQVFARGEALTEFFTSTLESRRLAWSGAAWERFGLLVESLHAAETRLQYVGIMQGDETLFYCQTRDNGSPPPHPVRTHERLLESGGNVAPVMVFEQEVPQQGEAPWIVELALRREILSDAERIPSGLLSSIYWFTLLIAGASLVVYFALLIWAIRRDRARELRRRHEEHLMFSGVLANGIAHDFRNPMSSARLDAQMLVREAGRDDGPRPERMKQLGERISKTMGRMDRVFQEFLSLGRPGVDTVESLDLLPCLRESIDTLAARAEQNNVTVRIECDDDTLRVLAEPLSLRRACVNILINAIEFTGPAHRVGAPEVIVRVLPEKTRVHIDILDGGPGISDNTRDKIFEMFYTTRAEGTGLGLFLARTAIEKCGGSVLALPNAPGGCIRITLRRTPS